MLPAFLFELYSSFIRTLFANANIMVKNADFYHIGMRLMH